MIEKVCSQCGERKLLKKFRSRRWKVKDGSFNYGYLAECISCLNTRFAAYYKKAMVENPEQFRNYKRIFVEKNRDSERARLRKYKRDNIVKLRPKRREYHQANKARWAIRAAERRAAERERTPSWANKNAIAFFYECRPDGCHVDHIVPLLGKNISGLHIETNLQWLPSKVNLSKGNRYELS